MPTPLRPVTAVFAALALLSVRAWSLDIQFDYTYDTNNFFVGHADRISLLDAAAAVFENRITDTLTAITPSTSNKWSADFSNPSTGSAVSVPSLSIATGVVKVYVGARALSSGTLGIGGPGGYQGLTGSASFVQAVQGRGQSGALTTPPTDFAAWGGAMTFDLNAPWYFGTGSLASKDDFLSVVTHELAHVIGFGTAPSWSSLVSGTTFLGTHARAANGNVQASLSADTGHWADGTLSKIFLTNTTQEAAMDPSLLVGSRKLFTALDFAGLQDVGWTVVPEPSAAVLLLGGMLVVSRRRR